MSYQKWVLKRWGDGNTDDTVWADFLQIFNTIICPIRVIRVPFNNLFLIDSSFSNTFLYFHSLKFHIQY